MKRVLLADSHPVVREGLRSMLAGEETIEVVGEASSSEEAIRKADKLKPDVVLVDIRIPGMGGIETTQRIVQTHPEASVLLLTMYDTEADLVSAISAGAVGYITKDCSPELLCRAIHTVAGGGTLLQSKLLRRAIQGLAGRLKGTGVVFGSAPSGGLTSRELQALSLVVQGRANKEIGREMELAEVTVKKHVHNFIAKLGVSDRTQAAILAVRMGLVD